MEHLKLSDGEWKLMKTLWARQGQTLAELVTALAADVGGTGDYAGRGYRLEPGNDFYDAQAFERQGCGHDG